MHNNEFYIGKTLEVEIESLSFGGNGIAKKEGLVIFVPFSAPEDVLEIKITKIKKNFVEGEILNILKSSPFRVAPRCSVYKTCGGCNWQHISYDEQLRQKEQIVSSFLEKLGSDFELLPIVKSPSEFNYRNRAQLKYESGNLGFYQKGTHTIIPIAECPLLESPLSNHLQPLLESLRQKNDPGVQKIEISLNKKGDVITKNQNESEDTEGFSQVNRFQNENLAQTLKVWCSDIEFSSFVDLYAGDGNFSFALSKAFPRTQFTCVELNESSVRTGRAIIKAQHLKPKDFEFYLSDVELFLKRFPLPKNSVVLVDPPRMGCSEYVMKSIAQSGAKRIFYISCDPAALTRDLERLIKANRNIKIHRAQVFDMFPQTHHIETLVELAVDR